MQSTLAVGLAAFTGSMLYQAEALLVEAGSADLFAALIESGVIGLVAGVFLWMWRLERKERIRANKELKSVLLYTAKLPPLDKEGEMQDTTPFVSPEFREKLLERSNAQ